MSAKKVKPVEMEVDEVEEFDSFGDTTFQEVPIEEEHAPAEEVTEEFEEEAEAEEEEEEESSPKKKRGLVIRQKPKANVYTMMMVVSLIAICIACFCLHLEMQEYKGDYKAKTAKTM